MIIYKGNLPHVKDAVKIANEMMKGRYGLLAGIKNVKEYDMANCSSDTIYTSMKYVYEKHQVVLNVKRYWNPFSKCVAWFNPKKPLDMNLNRWKVSRSKHSVVGSILHEYTHLVDNQYMHLSFGHGSNSRKGKQNTAPYKIGYIANNLSKAYCK